MAKMTLIGRDAANRTSASTHTRLTIKYTILRQLRETDLHRDSVKH